MDLDNLFKKRKVSNDFCVIDLFSASDNELQKISERMGLALSKQEMNNIKEYFKNKNRNLLFFK